MPPLSKGLARSRIAIAFQGIRVAVPSRNITTGRDRFFRVSEEVQDALSTGKPVVALETTIYTHGYPYPENVGLASHLESVVRVNGGVPATIGVVNGVARVGMSAEDLIELVSTAGSKDTWKVSRRDLGFLVGGALRGQRLHGGTTIAGTMILAHLAGIKIFATGGLGGVHRGGENSMDISADLTELGRTPVAVISSGCKSFLDIPRTLEYLETQGVGVGTFADGRDGHVDFPAFYCRDSGVPSPRVIQDEADAAAVVYAQFQFPIHSGLLFANPVPESAAMTKKDIDHIITQAVAEAEEKGIGGAANTPYILKRIKELSNNASIHANSALIEANVVRGTKVAVELAKMELRGGIAPERVEKTATSSTSTSSAKSVSLIRDTTLNSTGSIDKGRKIFSNADLLVAGSLACDTICDYRPMDDSKISTSPTLQTSNPAKISQSVGGVGRNVAAAAHLAGAEVVLASAVADDIAGMSLLDQMLKFRMTTKHIKQLSTRDGVQTAQYVATNDLNKDLVVAMADMSIFSRHELESESYWRDCMNQTKPKWLVVDANWSPTITSAILAAAKSFKIPIAFEPVSTAKAARFFHNDNTAINASKSVPGHAISLATPNIFELDAMYNAARDAGYFETEQWWEAINVMSMSSTGSRERFIAVTSQELVEGGVPQKCIQLLPYIPNLVTKLGAQGCLLTQLLKPGDPRLSSPDSAPYIVARNVENSDAVIGGVFMRLLPPSQQVPQEKIVSVNGVGDTMLGVIMAGLVKGMLLEEIIPIAQDAALLSLKSTEAVSSELLNIRSRIA